MAQELIARFRVVTPMFIGGARQDPSDGVRPPSVKGALRFWWRALNWGTMRKKACCDEAALTLLHDEEVRLFGGTAEQGGHGRFILHVREQTEPSTRVTDWPNIESGAGYMAFGILASGSRERNNYRAHRVALCQNSEFSVALAFRALTKEEDIEQIRRAIEAWGLFGGLGSRARRGMGSVSLVAIDNKSTALGRLSYETLAGAFINGASVVPVPPYTAFGKTAHFRVLHSGEDARYVLDAAGQMYRDFRHTIGRRQRIPFGLPLQGLDNDARRASPLLFHVHALADGHFAASVLYLPSTLFHQNYPTVTLDKVAEFARGGGA